RAGHVDSFAPGDGARLHRTETVPLPEARYSHGAVDRRVQGDGEDHPAPSSRSSLWRLLRILSSCILRRSSGVRCWGACRRSVRGLAISGSFDPRPRLINSRPRSITIAANPRRTKGLFAAETALSN